MKSSKAIKNEIDSLIKQRQDREADLKKHQLRQCSCVGKSPLRCEGMQKAVLSIISTLRGQIFHLRQQEIKAIAKEKADEINLSIHGDEHRRSKKRK